MATAISISADVRLAIVKALQDLAERRDVESMSDVNLHEIEDEILYVLLDFEWVHPDEAGEAAEYLAPQFDDLDCERY